MKLGDNIKYINEEGDEILAVLQKIMSDGKYVISLVGDGITIKVDPSEVQDI